MRDLGDEIDRRIDQERAVAEALDGARRSLDLLDDLPDRRFRAGRIVRRGASALAGFSDGPVRRLGLDGDLLGGERDLTGQLAGAVQRCDLIIGPWRSCARRPRARESSSRVRPS